VDETAPASSGLTYDSAGVSISAQDRAIELFAPSLLNSHTAALSAGAGRVLAGVGAFGAAFAPNLDSLQEPVLVSSTDGLGTKTLLHARFNSWTLAGHDLVGTVINDVLCSGARPLFMLDYIGWHGLTPEQLAAIVQGVAEGCSQAGCALIGGELAEMRSIYQHGDFDLTGTAVGVADRTAMLGAHRALIGLASSGVHANGFSLVRKVLEGLDDYGWEARIDTPRGPEPLWRALVTPTHCYAAAMAELRSAGVELMAAAHISGGGLVDNLPRVIPDGCCASVRRSAIPQQAVFATIQQRGQIGSDEMWHVFNMGCGFVLICAEEQCDQALLHLQGTGCSAFRIGSVEAAADTARFCWMD
jgi:phosphoribosylformylglycinamidine cyclo-ligase